MKIRLAPTLVLLAAACSSAKSPDGPAPLSVGSFLLTVSDAGLKVTPAAEPERVLLQTFAGGDGAYAPVAARKATAAWDFRYGAFNIKDGNQPWTSAARPLQLPTGAVRWLDAAGSAVAELEASAPADGALLLTFKAQSADANRVSVAFACEEKDRFLGFGAQSDALDHKGHKVPIWTSEPGIGKSTSDDPPEYWFLEGTRHGSSYGLPTWLSPRGYLGAVESDHRTIFELCSARADAWRVETWGPELKLWVFDGPAPAKALERATASVLGRPMVPPPLAFAPWNDALFGSANVRKIAKLLRDSHIPSSVIWTEDFRGGEDNGTLGYRLKEEWDTDRTLYPDVEQVAADLRAQGFAWFAYFNTFIIKDTRVFDEAGAGGHFVRQADGGPYLFDGATFKPTGLADLSRPETREWVKSYLRKALDQGFDGWMADYGEWLPHDAVLASKEDPLEAHNRYPREWMKLNAEVLAERAGDGRQRLFFGRSGWFGAQAFTPVLWGGDQRTDFEPDDGMPTVIPMGLGLGLAGVSTYGHDIGGYQSATNPPATKEVFFRWTSLGALSPVMRTHHGTKPAEQWWFGKDEETVAHFRRWARLHVQLFPYLYELAKTANATGLPLMRALPLEFPEDPAGWTLFDEYLLGPSLLVAPVQEAGKTSRKVHLPPGKWIPLEDGAAVTGPSDVEVQAPLTELPIFGRAGAVIPLLPEDVETVLPASAPTVDLAKAGETRVLLVFAGGEGEFKEGERVFRLANDPSVGAGFFVGGQALPACATAEQRGCVAKDGGKTRVRLAAGATELGMFGQRLTFSGVSEVVVRGTP